MMCGGKNQWTSPRTSGRVSIENEEADTRRYGQTCLAKQTFRARTGTRKVFPVRLTLNRIGNLTRLICTLLYVVTTHAYIYSVAYTLNSCLLSGQLGVVAGTLRGYIFPSAMARWVCNSRDSVLCARVLLLNNVLEKSEHNWLPSYWYDAAILASFCFIRVFNFKGGFRLSWSTRNKKCKR